LIARLAALAVVLIALLLLGYDMQPLKMAINFSIAIAKYAWHGFQTRAKQEYAQCLEACAVCPHIEPYNKQCKLCDCFVELKAALKTEDCPDIPSRWPPTK
jgi:hypothetical protein